MNVCILAGSPRTNSLTLRLSKAISHRVGEAGHTPVIVDFAHFDLQSEAQGENDLLADTPFRQNLRKSMADADVVVVVSPEYNWMPSAELLTFVNEFGGRSFADMWNNKVFALAGCSNGRGGRQPVILLAQNIGKILNFMDFDSFIAPKVFESQFTQHAIDEEGQSTGNADYDKGLNAFVNSALRFGARWKGR